MALSKRESRTAIMGVEWQSHPSDDYFIELGNARLWVWDKINELGMVATKSELDRAWHTDPGLLDDALRSLRDMGYLSYTSGTWWVRC